MDELMSRLHNMARVGSTSTMHALGDAFVEAAQSIAPVDRTNEAKHPGALRDSIRVAYQAPRAVGIVAGGESAPYAPAQEFGASPHQIYPNRAKRLNFFWAREGRRFHGNIGQPVSHPGNKPQPFFFPTIRAFGGYGVGGFFRSAGTKTISMVDAIGAEIRTLWNTGA
jgi:hypothetical protein